MEAVNMPLPVDVAPEGKGNSPPDSLTGKIKTGERPPGEPFRSLLEKNSNITGNSRQQEEGEGDNGEKAKAVLFPFLSSPLQLAGGPGQTQALTEGAEITPASGIEGAKILMGGTVYSGGEKSQTIQQGDVAQIKAFIEEGMEVNKAQELSPDGVVDRLYVKQGKLEAIEGRAIIMPGDSRETNENTIKEGNSTSFEREEISKYIQARKPVLRGEENGEVQDRSVTDGDGKTENTDLLEHNVHQKAGQQLLQGRHQEMDRLKETVQTGSAERIGNSIVDGRDRVVSQLVERLEVMVSDRRSEVRFQLKPESLGRVVIKLEMVDGAINGKMVVQNAELKEIVLANLSHLKDSLEQQGIPVSRFSVDVGGERSFSQQQFYQENRHFPAYRSSHSLYEEQEEALSWRWNDGGTVDYLA